jgi:hypothetical protein
VNISFWTLHLAPRVSLNAESLSGFERSFGGAALVTAPGGGLPDLRPPRTATPGTRTAPASSAEILPLRGCYHWNGGAEIESSEAIRGGHHG